MEFVLIKQLSGFIDLEQYGLKILEDTLSNFLSADVQIFTNPLLDLRKYGIEILENEKRGFYPIEEDSVVVLGRILNDDNKLVSALGVRISKKGIKNSGRFLTFLEGALTHTLTKEYKTRFRNCKSLLSDELILHTICNYLSKGGYDYRHIRHLISLFQKLRTTSFEGSFFSTGLIITKSHKDYNKVDNNTRFGKTYSLKKYIALANETQITRRVWYLVDGKRTFFMSNKSLVVSQLFVIGEEYQRLNYIDSHTLSKSLKGLDLLFKVENEKLISIINSSNIELCYLENQWKLRDYTFIRDLFESHFNNIQIVDSLLFFVIYCSKNSISSIIWLPEEMDKIDLLIKKATKNQFIKKPIDILDKTFTNHIIRYLSSDGATIIDKYGKFHYFGCIIDLNKIEVRGIKGTGESAAGALASNGISIKVSQDGTIKVFLKKNTKPVIL